MTGVEPSRWEWVWVSVALATVAALVYWLVAHQARARHRGNLPAQEPPRSETPVQLRSFDPWVALLTILDTPWIAQPLRLLYAVGLPAAALFWQHSLSMRGLGLQPLPTDIVRRELDLPFVEEALGLPGILGGDWLDWARDLGYFAVVITITRLVIAAGDAAMRRRPDASRQIHRQPLLVALRDAVYYQVHWAFYREPFVVTWGIPLGSWLGVLPVLLETVVNPIFWLNLRRGDASHYRRVLVRCGLFVAGTQLYLLTQNLWLAIATDALLGWLTLAEARPGLLPATVNPTHINLIDIGLPKPATARHETFARPSK